MHAIISQKIAFINQDAWFGGMWARELFQILGNPTLKNQGLR